MKKTYTQCQSCGMPLNKDKQGGGSEKDGSRSTMYCSSCYENGVFKNPTMSLAEMQQFVDHILKTEMKFPKILRWVATRQLPKLERWKNAST